MSAVCFWIICPSGPYAISPQIAAERVDAARPTLLGSYDDAKAACAPVADVPQETATMPETLFDQGRAVA